MMDFINRLLKNLKSGKQEDKIIEEDKLFPLSAIDNAENIDFYQKFLDQAIVSKQKNKIKNIALSGIYGAGKSTIIDTYLKNRPNLIPLRISISNFNGTPEINQIEQEILNQIFYQNSFETLAQDFKNFKPINKWYILFISTLFLIYLISIFIITEVKKTFVIESISNTIQEKFIPYIYFTSITIATLGSIIIIYHLIIFLKKRSISKIGFQGHQLEIKDTNNSILNRNLNEITYFFNNNNYDLVIFEDLDRLNQTEIFDILRNLNFIINSTPDRKNNFVIFLYAIREDIFKPEERVKFFELIIPVKPYSNINNSRQRLVEWNENLKLNLSKKTINSISPFLTDTRLIKNIINEFLILKNGISNSVSDKENKIFALAFYKNLNPGDFNLLAKRTGLLNFILSLKSTIIDSLVENYEESLNKKQKDIEDFKLKGFYSLKEYRQSILFEHFLENGIALQQNFVNRKNKQPIKTDEIISETFLYLLSEGNILGNSFPVVKISNEIIQDYELAKKILNENSQKVISDLTLEMNELNAEINKIRTRTFSELLKTQQLDCTHLIHIKIDETTKDNEPKYTSDEINLCIYLLREGLINEFYREYLTNYNVNNDNEFRISLLTHSDTNQFLSLNDPKDLIAEIDLEHFGSIYILNASIINYLLSNEKLYSRQLNLMASVFDDKQWKKTSPFVYNYLENQENEVGLFLNYLLYNNTNLYEEIIRNKNLKSIKQTVLNSCRRETFEKLTSSDVFNNEFNSDTIFKESAINKSQLEILHEVVEFKLKNVDESFSPTFLETIKTISAYEININNIRGFLGHRIDEYEFHNSNYEFIKQNDQQIFNHITKYIDTYICEVFTKLDSKQMFNNEHNFIELINSTENNIDEILAQSEIRISDINLISSISKAEKIILANKVIPTLKQLYYLYFNSESFEDLSCEFINQNMESIKDLTIELIKSKDENKNEILNIILNSNELNIASYQKFLTNRTIKSLQLSQIIDHSKIEDVDKLKLLIRKNLIPYSIENIENLLRKKDELLIFYLEKNHKKIIIQGKLDSLFEKINDENLVFKILESTIPNNFKQTFFIDYFETYNIQGSKLMNKIITMLINAETNEHRVDQVFEIIKYKVGFIYLRIELIMKYWNHLSKQNIVDGFNSFNDDYARIVDNLVKKGSVDNNIHNSKLINFLDSKNFLKIRSTINRITWTKNKNTIKF
ncbi:MULTISPECIES: YobI family P-loop NTPase [Sphingobacterium]|uniref:YobI-like P-loop NTPase domain-containing protein n=1 Tax=Sphingobacterium populi TaxID=1812824 RepID=A0ABW5UBD9_9SPHI|nr:hypothetical protein [Sphingobacterium sp. CFCC 11742]